MASGSWPFKSILDVSSILMQPVIVYGSLLNLLLEAFDR